LGNAKSLTFEKILIEKVKVFEAPWWLSLRMEEKSTSLGYNSLI